MLLSYSNFQNYLLLLSVMIPPLAMAGHESGLRGIAQQDNSLRCRLFAVDSEISVVRDGDITYRCVMDERNGGEMSFQINLPDNFNARNPDFNSGDLVTVPHGKYIEPGGGRAPYIEYPVGTDIVVEPHDGRFLLAPLPNRIQGNSSVLIVRVIAQDAEVSVSREEISGYVFGIGKYAQPVNIHSQYQACSFGKLEILPAEGPGVVDGVLDLNVAVNVTGADPFALENAFVRATEAILGSQMTSKYNHIVYCVPPGSKFNLEQSNWLGYAYMNSWRIMMNDRICINFSVMMHEIGHNLNLHHSAGGSSEYGDVTGLMGFSTSKLGTPLSCFNGNKNYYLGWYSDRTAIVDESKAWGGRLFAFVDYNNTPSDGHVLIKYGKLYIQWNRAKSFNYETRAYRNYVTIVHNVASNARSHMVGSVSAIKGLQNNVYRSPNHEGSGFDLVIEACEGFYGDPLEFLKMSIHLADGIQRSTCGVDLTPISDSKNSTTISPTNSPTTQPTPSPISSKKPTLAPTLAPLTVAPTASVYCEDSHNLTFSWQGKERTCTWLLGSPVRRKQLCAATRNHQARVACPETCGVCTDFCEDSQGDFYVNHKQLKKNCAWLSVRSKWQSRLCHRDDVKSLCKESCNMCDAAPP